MEKQDQISFGLRRITTEQFAIIDASYDTKKDEIVELGTGLRFGFNTEKRIVTVLLAINFSQDKAPFLVLEIGCVFQILEEHWHALYDAETKVIKLPKTVAIHMVMLAVGTIRGVLHAKTENTPYNKFYLPTINVNDLVKEDVIINTIDSVELK